MPKLDRKALQPYLSDYRLDHVIRVSKLARQLADHYGADTDLAELAGLTHDIAKEMNPNKLRDQLPLLTHYFDDDYQHYPLLWHGFVGPEIVNVLFGIDDGALTHAIVHHSTGAAKMPLLTQILYVADYCEQGRPYPTEELRELSFSDLNKTTGKIAQQVLAKLSHQDCAIHPLTEECVRFYASN